MTGQELDAYGRIAEAMATHILSGFMCRETFTKTANGRQVTIEAPYFWHLSQFLSSEPVGFGDLC
jgi:hypothetical protein